MIEMFPEFAAFWWHWAWSGFWQVAILIAVVALADRLLTRLHWPQLRLALWMLVVIKLLLPPTWYHPLSVGSALVAESEVPFLIYGIAHTLDQPFGNWAPFESSLAALSATVTSGVPQTWMLIAFTVWLVGVIVLGGAFIFRIVSLQQNFRREALENDVPRWLSDLVERTAGELRLRRTPPVIVTTEIGCPAVFGVLKPVVLMPRQTLETLSRADIRHILLHELSHVRRGDLVFQALFVWATILNWYNPLLYLIRTRIYEVRELSCDATVACRLRERTAAYRETLLRAAERLTRQPLALGVERVGLFENPAGIIRRLRSLEQAHWRGVRQRQAVSLLLVVAVAVFVLPMGRSAPPDACEHCHAPAKVAVAEHGLPQWSVPGESGRPLQVTSRLLG